VSRRRVANIAVGLGLFVVAGMAGCSHSSSKSSQSGASPKEALVASVRVLATTSYAVSLTSTDVTAIGAVDPVGGTATVTARGTLEGSPARIDVLMIAADSWAKVDLGAQSHDLGISPSKWMKLDPTKLTTTTLPFDPADLADAFSLSDVLSGLLSVKRTDAQHYTGTIDLASVHDIGSLIPAGNALGAAAKDVPFTATLDKKGRLTDFRVAGPSSISFDFGISDYSAAAPVNRPNDNQVVPAPTEVYSILDAS
jgi:hypothetical protein